MAVSRHTPALFPSHRFANEALWDFRLGGSDLFYPLFFLCQNEIAAGARAEKKRAGSANRRERLPFL
jgi:hypothetical protein